MRDAELVEALRRTIDDRRLTRGERKALRALLEDAGFTRVRSAVVSGFRFRKASTADAAEEFGVKAVMMTATKPE